jgi:hypothetical protein
MKKLLLILSITLIIAASFTTIKIAENEIPYPEGYRHWTFIKTKLVGPKSPGFAFNGGFNHIYANEKAMQGYVTGKFPEGAVLVFDVIDAAEANGNAKETNRNHVDVMIKDSVKFATTGGWGYEEFKGSSKTERLLTPTAKTQCFNCHAKQDDYVFSEFKE